MRQTASGHTAETKHTAEEFRSLDICCTYEDRSTLLGKFNYFIDYRIVLSLLRLIDKVILVITGDRSVCRDHHDVKLVDRPELAEANSPLPPSLQKMQPPELILPSLFGQLMPPFKVSL